MESASQYVFFADRWHWTPDQVDELPAWLRARMPAAAALADEVRTEKERAAAQ